MFPYVPQSQVPAWDDTYLRPIVPISANTFGTRDDQATVWPSTPGAHTANNSFLTPQGYVPMMQVPMQVPMQMQGAPAGWAFPTNFAPLPPSPSMLAAAMLPLPPSPRGSPRLGPVALQPMIQAPVMGVGVPGWYPQHPIDPYYLPQAGVAYQNPHYTPRTRVHPVLSTDTPYLVFDLASPSFKPLTFTQTPSISTHGPPSWFFTKSGLSTIPLHRGYLEQVATYPPTHKMYIEIPALGTHADAWKVTVTVDSGRYISVADILKSIHSSLRTQVTHSEWDKVTDREFREASEAYNKRTRHEDMGERVKGVLRVDFLGNKHFFAGIARVKDEDHHHFKLHVKSPPTKD